jgi:hypothetical protein
MTSKTTSKFAIAAAALTLTVAAQAKSETAFSTLAALEAEPMSATEMEAVQGKEGFFGGPILTDDLVQSFQQAAITGNWSVIAAQISRLTHPNSPYPDPQMVQAAFCGINQVYAGACGIAFPAPGGNVVPMPSPVPVPLFSGEVHPALLSGNIFDVLR